MKVAFKCKWGEEVEVGDKALAGTLYQRWGQAETSYVLLKNSYTMFMHAKYICIVKFVILPKDYRVQGHDLVYELPLDVLSGIKERIAILNVDDN